MKIKAKDGVMLRDPVSFKTIAPEGVQVDDNDLFWVRRVRDGDALIVNESPPDNSSHEGDTN